jgi:phosphoglycolate phosphatase
MRLVIFDVDGTLVDSQDVIVAAQRATFAALGMKPPTRERSLSIVGLSLHEAFVALVGPEAPIKALVDGYKAAFQELRADPGMAEPLFPGAAEVLGRLSRREDVVLGIATGKSRRGVAHLLDRHGWERLFATIQTADDAPSKPDPGMLLRAMSEIGAAPEDTVMVGDTTFDMTMAKAAGVTPLGVTWGYHRPHALREAGAEGLVGSFPELWEHLAAGFLPASRRRAGEPISCP